MSRPIRSLLNQRFGSLVVIAGPFRSPRNAEKTRFEAAWKCQCDCGKFWFVSSGHLSQSNVTSCGCVRSQLAKTKRRKKEVAHA